MSLDYSNAANDTMKSAPKKQYASAAIRKEVVPYVPQTIDSTKMSPRRRPLHITCLEALYGPS